MHFIYIYTVEAHPIGSPSPYSNKEWLGAYSFDAQGNPVNQAITYEERVEHARKTKMEAGINILILVDEMDNPVWSTYGPAPNISYLIGTDGKIIVKQGWYDPKLMEQEIGRYLTNHAIK